MTAFSSIKYLGVAAVVAICLILFGFEVIWRGPATLIEPIHISQQFKKRGYSEEELQHMLIDTFDELRSAAKSVTPKPSDKEEASSELNLPDISVPGTGSSVRPLIEYSRSLLGKDSSVSGSVAGSTAVFSMTLTLRDSNGDVLSFNFPSPKDAASRGKSNIGQADKPAAERHTLEDVLRNAAIEILKHQSLLTYAGYLTQMEQLRCIEHGVACKFGQVRELYEQMAARESDGKKKSEAANPAWARLALAKLDTFNHNLEGAIAHAREIVDLGKAHPNWTAAKPWAYYSWGVALNDLGCYERAAEVLQQAVNLNPGYAAAYNALARSYLALARADSKPGTQASAGSSLSHDYRKDALDRLKQAIDLDPNYQEAYLNRGDALVLPQRTSAGHHAASLDESDAQNAENARKAYRDAVALNLDTAAHAYERLAAIHDTTYLTVSDRITKKQPRCKIGMVRSLLESWGCADAEMDPSASSKGRLKHTAFQRDEKLQAVCSKPELILHDKAFPRLPGDSQSTIVATRPAPSIPARTTGLAPADTLSKVSMRGNPVAGANL
jgi:tetratricopeptide (TPR) repeat protein